MRVFLGLPLSDDLKENLWSQAGTLREAHPDYRWVSPECYHITLLFIGELDRTAVNRIVAKLSIVAAGIHPFDISLDCFGHFPSGGRPRVLYAAVGTGADRCITVYENAVGITAEFVEPEGRPYRPHITLARVKRHHSRLDRLLLAEPLSGVATIDRVILYESRLGPRGARYHPVHEAPLPA